MIHEREQYPDKEDCDPQKRLVEEKDWDCLAVFDACRWDAFSEEIRNDVRKVRSPASNTNGWLNAIWNRDDDLMDDVTYISANPMTDWIAEEHDNSRHEPFNVDDVVDTYVRAYEDGHSKYVGTTTPDIVMDHVKENKESPMVVHFMQPHTPFIGAFGIRATGTEDVLDWLPDIEDHKPAPTYSLVRSGDISPRVMRKAYIENLKIVWRSARQLKNMFDTTVYTADHGEALGPDKWNHGGINDSRARVVPWWNV